MGCSLSGSGNCDDAGYDNRSIEGDLSAQFKEYLDAQGRGEMVLLFRVADSGFLNNEELEEALRVC